MKEYVLTNSEAQRVDRYTIDKLGVPGIKLMEKAGNFVAFKTKIMLKHIPGSKIDIFCGTGNNGGDGFVAALKLIDWGASLRIIICGDETKIKGDARHFYEKCCTDNLPIINIRNENDFNDLEYVRESDLIIDALLGTGFRGELQGVMKKAVEIINSTDVNVLSVDIPSGVNGDTGAVKDLAVKAERTVTMGFLKLGLLLFPGHKYAGNIILVDLDYPEEAFKILGASTAWVRREYVQTSFKEIPEDTYKHKQGKVLMFAGSTGMTGAAVLTAQAAMRSGAGLVLCAVPESLNDIMEIKLTEPLTKPVPQSVSATFVQPPTKLAKTSIDWADVVVFGPGVSGHPEVQAFGEKLVQSCSKPIVIDADGLRIFHNKPELIRDHDDLILTPHLGEFGLLVKQPIHELNGDVIARAREFVNEYPCTLVLKSYRTIIVNRDGTIAMNPTGNPGLASGGTGDVLTGMIAAFRAQGIDSFPASVNGAAVHGFAADLGKQVKGIRGLIASDLLKYIPLVLKKIEQSNQ